MKILFTCHHRIHPDAGAPGLTLALGAALQRLGCDVDYYGFQHAFSETDHEGVARQLAFPWRTAQFLRRRGVAFDVVDAMSGDAWVWASIAGHRAPKQPALFTRAHGLEHVASRAARHQARNDGRALSWKYPIYHGGYRLWEVRRSMVAADHCLVYNSIDREYLATRLGVPRQRVTVVPNGVMPHFLDAPDVAGPPEGPIRLAFVGTWIPRKGTRELVTIVRRLLARNIDFTLAIVGSGKDEDPMRELPTEAATRISVIPTYSNEDLPGLLQGCEVLVFPSHSEGFSVALLEAMACGLVPVAAAAGAAPDLIDPRSDGFLVGVGDNDQMVDAIARLAADRGNLCVRRRAAQHKARGHRWERIATDTLALYERVFAEHARSST